MKHITIITLVCIGSFFLVESAMACSQKGTKVENEHVVAKRKAALQKTGEQLIDAIKKGDTEQLLGLIVDEGFGFEESKQYNKSELKEMFKKKEGFYCYFFDAECVSGYLPDGYRFYSLQEIITKSKHIKITALLAKSSDGVPLIRGGNVWLKWEEKPFRDPIGMEFTFAIENGRWRMTGFLGSVSGPQ